MTNYYNREEAEQATAILNEKLQAEGNTRQGTIVRTGDMDNLEKEYAYSYLSIWHNGHIVVSIASQAEFDAFISFMELSWNLGAFVPVPTDPFADSPDMDESEIHFGI